MSEQKQDRDFVTALARGLSILQSFTPQNPEMGTVEIAARLGLPQSTVWRLCYTLQKLGFLVPGQSDKLRVGSASLTLGYAAMHASDLVQYAYPLMHEMALRFDTGISLAVRYGPDMLLLQRASAPGTLQLNVRVGSRLPVMHSALGWAYLSGLGDTDRKAALSEIAALRPQEYQDWLPALDEVIAQYRRDGYSLSLRTIHPAIHAVSIPLAPMASKPAMALSCAGIAEICPEEMLVEQVAPSLKELARKLEAHLLYAH